MATPKPKPKVNETPEPDPAAAEENTPEPAAEATPTPKSVTTDKPSIEIVRIKYAFYLGVIGLAIVVILAMTLAWLTLRGFQDAQTVAVIVSPFLTVLGTLVGAFFGLQIGSAGTDQLNQQVQDANNKTEAANTRAAAFAAAVDPSKIQSAIEAFNKLTPPRTGG